MHGPVRVTHAFLPLQRAASAPRVVMVSSAAGWGADAAPVRPIPIRDVATEVEVVGPVPGLVDRIETLHRAAAGG